MTRNDQKRGNAHVPDAEVSLFGRTAWHHRLPIGLLLIGTVGFVWWRAWVCDDAFISFRHVTHCLAGYGPVFNIGERVQGLTHPLWFLLLLAVGSLAGVYAAAVVCGLASTAAIVLLLHWQFRGYPRPLWLVCLAVGLLFSSPTFVEYQTSGLETPLTSMLVVLLCGLAWRPLPGAAGVWLVSGLLVLNRPDHVFLVAPLAVWVLIRTIHRRQWRAMAVCAIACVPVVAWHTFATIYYGTPLPNTAYAKSSLPLGIACAKGLAYLRDYAGYESFHAFWAAAVLAVALATNIRGALRGHAAAPTRLCLVLGVLAQLGYVISIGGDFMRGRFLLAAMTATAVLGVHMLAPRLKREMLERWGLLAMGLVLMAGCVWTAGRVDGMPALRWGLLCLQDMFVVEPLMLAALATLAAVGTWWGRRRLRQTLPFGRAADLFLGLLLASTVYLLVLTGHHGPARAVVVLFAATLGMSAYALAAWCGGQRKVSSAFLAVATLLAAAASSLTDIGRRTPGFNPTCDAADEYAWYRKAWSDSRLAEEPVHGNSNTRAWATLGDACRRYTQRYGRITVVHNALGVFSTHAGPLVCVLDSYGLTDAYIARLPADAHGRVGHMSRAIPPAYLESRGAVNLLPDWERRLKAMDPTLVADAKRMQQEARWVDPDAHRRWEAVRLVISGDIMSAERWRQIPGFILGR